MSREEQSPHVPGCEPSSRDQPARGRHRTVTKRDNGLRRLEGRPSRSGCYLQKDVCDLRQQSGASALGPCPKALMPSTTAASTTVPITRDMVIRVRRFFLAACCLACRAIRRRSSFSSADDGCLWVMNSKRCFEVILPDFGIFPRPMFWCGRIDSHVYCGCHHAPYVRWTHWPRGHGS